MLIRSEAISMSPSESEAAGAALRATLLSFVGLEGLVGSEEVEGNQVEALASGGASWPGWRVS